MASNSDDFTPQQYKKYNGQSVFKALSAMGSSASAGELANFISEDIGASEEVILPEVRNVLRRGIINGFLQRNGQFYSFITDEHNMQTDSVRPRSSQRMTRKGRVSKQSRSSKIEENVSEDELGEEEQSDEDENRYDNPEEMQTDSSAKPPKVKLYEIYNPPAAPETDDEHSEEGDEDDDYDKPPPQKRIRLLPILTKIVKKH